MSELEINPVLPVVITTTADDRGLLNEIAKRLIDEQLAACCQIVGPHTSYYRWEGEVEESIEWMCLIKTSGELYSEVERVLLEMHTYEVPEIIATPVTACGTSYANWLHASLVR